MAKKNEHHAPRDIQDMIPQARYTVRLKPGHPTGVYRRAGLTFSATAPTLIDGEVPAAVAADAWLLVRAIPPAREEG